MAQTLRPNKPPYEVQISRSVQKELDRQARNTRERLLKAILALADNPRPTGSRRIEGQEDIYRVRVGDWRIIYVIYDERLVITVIKVGSRGDVYRGF